VKPGGVGMRSLPYFWPWGGVRANFPDSVVAQLPADIGTGIYYGWACVGSGRRHKMVTSIGWNPYYNNTHKSMETHVIHTFKEDFYGQVLSLVLVGYIRPERSFKSLDDLVTAIHSDIEAAKQKLEQPEHLKLKDDVFFQTAEPEVIMNGH
uniref:riboflavin kinase n=1 Tax=Denticeps clupeoides TaxID=299321 RepID=A0AAY4CN93_9TELE